MLVHKHGMDNMLSNDSTEALFDEVALILEDDVPPPPTTLPEASKTPPTNVQEVDLATAVDGSKGNCALMVCPCSTNSTNSLGTTVLYIIDIN